MSGYSASKYSAGFICMWLNYNVAVGVMVRAAAGVSVRAATRAATRAAVRAVARNKPMRFIGSRLLSQLSVA